ncbi:MAG TPA: enoyl-CoA hydratase-related protein [Steroidobacteraceae bacterium]|nr:enoyl-CoA hydratase-related protein [Steroidobacteraceae bacterium]
MTDSVLVSTDERGIALVTMHRPERHNAFDGAMIRALDAAVAEFENDARVRVIVLTGSGKSFCSGADLGHMSAMLQATEQANYEDALGLARLLRRLAECDKPLIARVNGNAFGGAVGLIACADVTIAVTSAQFALSEVRLGLVPATISPYVVDAIGARAAKRLTLTGERFGTDVALGLGLVHVAAEPDRLDETVEAQIGLLLAGGPLAQAEAKRLFRRLCGLDARAAGAQEIETARLLARIRVGDEAQEGMAAFLGKRKPHWSRS